MKCKKPVWRAGAPRRCMRCRNCKIDRRDKWVMRTMLEVQSYKYSVLLTFTYDKAFPVGFLNYRDLQAMWKRYRAKGNKVRFLAVGEYGSKNGRQHWHVIAFSDTPLVAYELYKCWQLGYVYRDRRPVTARAVRYVLKYLFDNDDKGDNYVFQPSRKPGLGCEALYNYGVLYAEKGGIVLPPYLVVDGKSYTLDRTAKKHFIAGMLDAGVTPEKAGSVLTSDVQIKSLVRHLEHTRLNGDVAGLIGRLYEKNKKAKKFL